MYNEEQDQTAHNEHSHVGYKTAHFCFKYSHKNSLEIAMPSSVLLVEKVYFINSVFKGFPCFSFFTVSEYNKHLSSFDMSVKLICWCSCSGLKMKKKKSGEKTPCSLPHWV